MIHFVDAAFLSAFTEYDIKGTSVCVLQSVFRDYKTLECPETYELTSTQKYFTSVVKIGFKIPSYQKFLLTQSKVFPMYHLF